MTAYSELEGIFRRIGALGEAAGMLHWDTAVMMPTGGAEARAEQVAALDVTIHEMLTAPEVAGLLAEAEGDDTVSGDPWRAANLREMGRRYVHGSALDGGLVEASSKASASCEMIWREARAKSDFAAVAPSLEELIGLVRQKAAAKAAALGCDPYGALVDQFEPGCETRAIDELFEDLSGFLPGFLDDVLARQGAGPEILEPEGPFPIAAQRALVRTLMERLGFDFAGGRLDISLHPFCGGVPEDLRITTRYDEADFNKGLMGVMHETGHALYERGLPKAWRLQPVGHARGMALHESQSLLIEMQVCRGPDFLHFAAPLMAEAFGGGPAWEVDNLSRLYTRVARGLIRVDADEVTYPAHVILRTRLERALLAGDLAVADLPAAWNEAMEELLGITPPDDAMGVLQDIHWFDGALGYFPTYTLGALAAAQLYKAARAASGDIAPAIAAGNFAPLMGWLATKIHAKGSLLSTDELMVEATGAPLSADAFKAHLKARYLGE